MYETRQVPRSLLHALASEEPCHLDHDGNCQAHLWSGETDCPQLLLRPYLEEEVDEGWAPCGIPDCVVCGG